MSVGQTSRQHILGSVKRALDARSSLAARATAVDARLAATQANTIPARGQSEGAARTKLFVEEAERANAEVLRLKTIGEIPAAVKTLLGGEAAFKAAPGPFFQDLDWNAAGLSPAFGRAQAQDHFGLSKAWSAVAETGTLVLLSGPTSPVTLNFLPDVHVIVVLAGDIEASYEATWSRLRRERTPANGAPMMPRTVNWITGPSRTADIEQTILLGAHGPRRLVIVLVDGEKTPSA